VTIADVLTPLRWRGDALELLDQLRLPGEEVWIRCDSAEDVARAIRDMVVRGAPAIGCAAAYGVALAAHRLAPEVRGPELIAELERAIDLLRQTRPTAINLFWALERMRGEALRCDASDAGAVAVALSKCAAAIQAEDIEMCMSIGRHGAALIGDDAAVLTHCNAGALATGGFGTALGVVRAAHAAGKNIRVLAGETRPFLQGARLTAWELLRDGIQVTLIPDGAAYALALAADRHRIPFYVAAPTSTLDPSTPTGADIPIEERAGDELLSIGGKRIAAAGARARYPAFDVTPAELVTAIVTDRGVARPPYLDSLRLRG
jgi:methylthioribose-1-phosphate isomerase